MIGRFYSGIKLVLPYSLSGDEYQWGGVIYGRGATKKNARSENRNRRIKTKRKTNFKQVYSLSIKTALKQL
jgi:hypothetical protein